MTRHFSAIVRAATLSVISAMALFAIPASADAGSSSPPPLSGATAESPLMIYSPDGSQNAIEGGPSTLGSGAVTAGFPATEISGPMPFNGGYVQHRPYVHIIFWGSEWNNYPGTKEKLIGLFQWLPGSSYANILTQFFDHSGYISNQTDVASFTDTRVVRPPLASPADVRAEVDWAIQNQPGWQTSFDNQYIVFTPPATAAPEGYCGYHGWSGQYAYSYIPWSPPECRRGLEPWGAMQVTASHEWSEMATDPIPLPEYFGWTWDQIQGEIADLCNTGTAAEQAEPVPGLFVAKLADDYLWSANGTPCVAQDPAPIKFQVNTGGSSVGLHSATLTGSVTPGGWPAYYQFVFTGPQGTTYIPPRLANGPEKKYGFAPVEQGFAPVPVSTQVTNLKGNTTYNVTLESVSNLTEPRVISNYGNVQIISGGQTQFTTPDWRPLISSESVSGRTTTWTNLNASINPQGTSTHYAFEYGSTSAYGKRAPVPDADAGSGGAFVPVSQSIGGLKPETAYHYRVVATNSEGTTVGPDRSFTTLAVPPSLNRTFGALGSGNGQLKDPAGMAVDAEGNLWVADRENNRVEKFNPKGEYLSQFGTKGSGNGQFNNPTDIAIAPNGHLWVTDTGNDRVQRFTPEGVYFSQTGTSGTGAGQFIEPYGIVFVGNSFWVTDTGRDRIEQFNAMGTFVREVHGSIGGTGPGEFNHPTGLAADQENQLWVTDTGNNRLQQFTSTGSFVSAIGSAGSGQGALNAPHGIAVKPSGTLWVVDKGNSRVQQLSQSGEYLAQFGVAGSGTGQFKEPKDIVVGPGGVEYVSDSGNARIQKLSQPYYPEAVTRPAANVTGQTITLNGIVNPSALSTSYYFEYGTTTEYGTNTPIPSENVGSGVDSLLKSRVIEGLQAEATYHYRIVATNSEGTTVGPDMAVNNIAVPAFTNAFGSLGTSNGQFNHPVGGAIDPSGNLWIADRDNNRIQKFNSNGEFLSQFGSKGSGNGQFSAPTDVAFTTNGASMWVVDSGNDRIQKFTPAGVYQAQIGSSGSGPGQFVEPFGIVVSEGHVWVSDAGGNRLEEFNSQNFFMTEIHGSGPGGGDGEFIRPMGITADSNGHIWVADTGNNRVQELDAQGNYVSKFGKKMGPVQFDEPVGVDIRPSGNVAVVEKGADRVQIISPSGKYLTQFGEAGTGPGQFVEPQGLISGLCGREFIADTGNSRVERWTRFSGPEAVTEDASTMKSGEAVLRGTINPCGSVTTYRFDYGATTAYGKSIPVPAESIGGGSVPLLMSKAVTGLAAGTYHFRVVASNSQGTTYGKDDAFTVH